MAGAVRILGIGVARAPDPAPGRGKERAGRVQALLAALSPEGPPARLLHTIEELTVLAAHEALRRSGLSVPYRGDDLGIALGLEEGIDGIKARYYDGVLREGPLGASPLTFPLTTPNTVAARIAILFDLRGEAVTVGGGCIAGAQAVGLAVQALREQHIALALAGSVTCLEPEFLETASRVHPSASQPACGGACLFLLESGRASRPDGVGTLMGYGEGFGRTDVQDAIRACLDDAGIPPRTIGAVRTAAVRDWPSSVRAVREAGVAAGVESSPSAGLHAAAFPLAVAEAVGQPAHGTAAAVLVIGSDCLAGAAAAVVRGGA